MLNKTGKAEYKEEEATTDMYYRCAPYLFNFFTHKEWPPQQFRSCTSLFFGSFIMKVDNDYFNKITFVFGSHWHLFVQLPMLLWESTHSAF